MNNLHCYPRRPTISNDLEQKILLGEVTATKIDKKDQVM